jgi:carbamoyltransferase
MKDVLNMRVKQREPFRPFAPSIIGAALSDWYNAREPSPFMLLVLEARADRRETIPAVTHVDGSGRVQTVEADVAPRFHRLLTEFERATGVPILLNTSFNENEPIVCRPKEAIECYLRTRMDALVIGNYVVRKD